MSPGVVFALLAAGAIASIVGAGVYAAARGWDELFAIGLGFVALVPWGLAYGIYEAARRRRRRNAAAQAAPALGLVPESEGGAPLPPLPAFQVWRSGSGTPENVLAGEVGEAPVWLFDYTYTVSTGDGGRHERHFSCALTELAGSLPSVRLAREGALSRIARRIVEDVELGDERFDRTFSVTASDRDAAAAILDTDVRAWLLTLPPDVSLETSGRFLLAYTKQRNLDELRPLLEAVTGLRDRLRRTAAT